ncbi:polysaccharide deacetylase family protein [candidate division WOR-3 bacterium]|nr:polysaccharide deacetylase family protein [candidate division WOR-3 bacterium]
MENSLNCGIEMNQELGLKLSLPVTAIILERHPEIIRNLQDKGVELAVHGYVHTDYTELSREKQLEHFEHAIKIFKKQGIRFRGFRAPYVKWNEDTMAAIHELGFLWESSKTVMWNVLDDYEASLPKKNWEAYKKVLKLYNPVDAFAHPVLPEIKGNFVEIPLSLPDDEMLVDRLHLPQEKIKEVWQKILSLTYERGELFTLQVHPERFPFLREEIKSVIEQARMYNPKIWIASLDEIARWWGKKEKKTRWPNGARSCLSITGDIDALTLFDFFMRIFGK